MRGGYCELKNAFVSQLQSSARLKGLSVQRKIITTQMNLIRDVVTNGSLEGILRRLQWQMPLAVCLPLG